MMLQGLLVLLFARCASTTLFSNTSNQCELCRGEEPTGNNAQDCKSIQVQKTTLDGIFNDLKNSLQVVRQEANKIYGRVHGSQPKPVCDVQFQKRRKLKKISRKSRFLHEIAAKLTHIATLLDEVEEPLLRQSILNAESGIRSAICRIKLADKVIHCRRGTLGKRYKPLLCQRGPINKKCPNLKIMSRPKKINFTLQVVDETLALFGETQGFWDKCVKTRGKKFTVNRRKCGGRKGRKTKVRKSKQGKRRRRRSRKNKRRT